jgi:hypothetical protein
MGANTPLDQFIERGLLFLEGQSGEAFTFRGASYTGQISGLGTSEDWMAGGKKKKRRCTIVFTPRSEFLKAVETGEKVIARGVNLAIESLDRDGSSYLFECVEVER